MTVISLVNTIARLIENNDFSVKLGVVAIHRNGTTFDTQLTILRELSSQLVGRAHVVIVDEDGLAYCCASNGEFPKAMVRMVIVVGGNNLEVTYKSAAKLVCVNGKVVVVMRSISDDELVSALHAVSWLGVG